MPAASKPKKATPAAAAPLTVISKPADAGLVRSMTGYGRATAEGIQRVTAEIRSVNGRFLKLSVKVLGRYGALEDRVKTLLNEMGIKRGSVDVSLYFDNASEEGNFGINEAAVRHYTSQARAISKKLKLKGDVPLAALLPLPGVIKREEVSDDIEAVWALSRQALMQAIDDFTRMREKEGAAIVADIRSHVAQLALHHSMIQTIAPEALKAGIQKFKDRITKLLEQAQVSAPLNPDVLERETVLQTDRTDISEEIARLQSHFEQIEATLKGGGETGKKLDFLTQELFRETNTIGSKCSDERITHRVVEMKGLIEKIREQVQNLE
ncbi:MAG TPA: YicC/YloC family endoribonuclease [Planctomycetota bacterium]|nr:YicC/YloC family endoribonuclease [Planctomycetota bacterium]